LCYQQESARNSHRLEVGASQFFKKGFIDRAKGAQWIQPISNSAQQLFHVFGILHSQFLSFLFLIPRPPNCKDRRNNL
jgi:hypothetical protein